MKIDKELLKGATETMVLAVLAEAPSYGYKLAQHLRERSRGVFELGEGTLYPLLYKLEAKGFIRGVWQAGRGERRRRVYCVTNRGRGRLEKQTQQWQQMVYGMSLVLGAPAHA